MSEKEKPDKRVGSWREYIAYVAEKGFISSLGIGLMLVGFPAVIGIAVIFCIFVWAEVKDGHTIDISGILAMLLMTSAIFGFLAWLGNEALQSARKLPPVLPPTRQNIASSLPAEDILVRASAEPTGEARKTLLRATVADTETPAEELLRPTLERQ